MTYQLQVTKRLWFKTNRPHTHTCIYEPHTHVYLWTKWFIQNCVRQRIKFFLVACFEPNSNIINE